MNREQRERIVAAYRGWASSYDRLMRSTYHRVERAISRAHILREIPPAPDATLLDAGGGDATWSMTLIAEGRAGRAVLLDVSPDMLGLARRKLARRPLHVSPSVGELSALPFGDDAFDTTLALGGVLSHLPDPDRGAAELVRVTRPGGHLVVSVDALAVGLRTARRARDDALLRSILETGAGRAFHHPGYPFDVRFFSPEEIRALLTRQGVEVLSLIGKPVFTRFLAPKEVLSEDEVAARVEMEMPFVAEPAFVPFADQVEVVARVR